MNSIKAWVKCNIIQEPSLSILLRLNCSVHGTPRRHYLNPLGLLVCLEFVYVTVSTNKYWAVKGSCQVICISVCPDHDALYIADLPYIFLNEQMNNLNKITFFSTWNMTFLLLKHVLGQAIYLWTSIYSFVEEDIHLRCKTWDSECQKISKEPVRTALKTERQKIILRCQQDGLRPVAPL